MNNRKPRSGGNVRVEPQQEQVKEPEIEMKTTEHERNLDKQERQPVEPERDPRETRTREELQSIAKRRASRIPIGREQRLSGLAAPYRDKNLYHRFVLDKPGAFDTKLRAGYEFQLDSEGKHITFPSGSSHLHLMKLPIEFRQDDLEAREDEIKNRFKAQIAVAEEDRPGGEKVALSESGLFEPD